MGSPVENIYTHGHTTHSRVFTHNKRTQEVLVVKVEER